MGSSECTTALVGAVSFPDISTTMYSTDGAPSDPKNITDGKMIWYNAGTSLLI